jgi:response regulator of citrate/malate metabolism
MYLTVVEIAEGTGLSPTTVRRLAERAAWTRQVHRTGRRGRPEHRYLAEEVMATFAVAA